MFPKRYQYEIGKYSGGCRIYFNSRDADSCNVITVWEATDQRLVMGPVGEDLEECFKNWWGCFAIEKDDAGGIESIREIRGSVKYKVVVSRPEVEREVRIEAIPLGRRFRAEVCFLGNTKIRIYPCDRTSDDRDLAFATEQWPLGMEKRGSSDLFLPVKLCNHYYSERTLFRGTPVVSTEKDAYESEVVETDDKFEYIFESVKPFGVLFRYLGKRYVLERTASGVILKLVCGSDPTINDLIADKPNKPMYVWSTKKGAPALSFDLKLWSPSLNDFEEPRDYEVLFWGKPNVSENESTGDVCVDSVGEPGRDLHIMQLVSQKERLQIQFVQVKSFSRFGAVEVAFDEKRHGKDACGVCSIAFKSKDVIVSTDPCEHNFHLHCLHQRQTVGSIVCRDCRTKLNMKE